MKIKDILQKDPSAHPLVNQGQARISDLSSPKALEELRGELASFVCEGQYAEGLQRTLSSFLADLSRTSQKAAWFSGFFGSGKSHLAKMACHLWRDTRFPDGATARSLVPAMPEEIRTLLRELDTAGKRSGGLFAAAGALPSGSTDHVRLTILGVLLRGAGLSDLYPQAMFCLWLHEQGWFERVKGAVEKAGRQWESELNNLYVSGPLADALLACDADFAPSAAKVREVLRAQFPRPTEDIGTPEFLRVFKRVLSFQGRQGRYPCTLLVLDEVQQYIGRSSDRATFVTEATEAITKELEGHVMVIATGQNALTEVEYLQKLMDRYRIAVLLSDADVEAVTRKVLLQKKPSAVAELRRFLDANSGEISRQLQGTRIGERAQDREVLADDYPLLPVRRRFWEHCFRQVDAAGTHSQLRSQLRIIHDALVRISERELGAVIPADELYEALAPDLVVTGVLLREINERIVSLSRDGTENGRLARRIAGLIFLISRLSRDGGADIGVRASVDHLADLLLDDLRADRGMLRDRVETVLKKLTDDGAVMQVGDEYRLQTREGSEWDREFRNRQTKLANDEADIQIRRDALIAAEVGRVMDRLKVTQGASKVARIIDVSRETTPPEGTGESIPIWVRDAWSASEKDVVQAARAVGTDGSLIGVFIQRQSAAEELRRLIVEAEAAEQTLAARGTPATPEGEEARQGMQSRRNLAVRQRDEIIQRVVEAARVFQGGGTELLQPDLEERLRAAVDAALARQFPRFGEADSAAWGAVIKRARDGADQPFLPVGHQAATEQHPVCRQVLATIGAGKTGADMRKALRRSPFGWPQDAVDAALIALHGAQQISATLNETVLSAGQLDQNKISKSEFRVERITIRVTERLALRKLFQSLGVECKAGEEAIQAPGFLKRFLDLASSCGGEPPLPAPPSTADLDGIRHQAGNELLAAIRDRAAVFAQRIGEWTRMRAVVETRKPVWLLAERMARHAEGLPAAAEPRVQLEALRSERLLLEPTDPVAPLRAALADVLRRTLADLSAEHQRVHDAAMNTLESNEVWNALAPTDRTEILASVGLQAPAMRAPVSDEDLLVLLDERPLSARRADADAVPGRIQRAIELAAKRLEPEVRPFRVERTTLRTRPDVEQWLSRQKDALLRAVDQSPLLIE